MRTSKLALGLALLLAASDGSALPALFAPGHARLAVRLPDGAVVVAGQFSSVAQTPRTALARLTPGGTFDPSWAPSGLPAGFAPALVALAASPDGSSVYLASGTRILRVAAGATGALQAFDANVSGSVDGSNSGIRSIAVDAVGRVYVAGAFAYVNGVRRDGLARLGSDGTLDADWKPAANSTVNAIAIGAAHAYLAGAFVNLGGQPHLRLARVALDDGVADAQWNPTASGAVRLLAPSVDANQLVLAGDFSAVDGTARPGVARIAVADGSVDGWAPALAGSALRAIRVAADHVDFGGEYGCCGSSRLVRVASADASIDPNWQPSPDGIVDALLDGGNGKTLAFGDFGRLGATPALAAATIDASGSASPLVDIEREAAASVLLREADGSVLAAGDFRKVDGVYRHGLFRLAAGGTVDEAFDPPAFGGVGPQYGALRALATDPASGWIYVGGAFTSVGSLAQAAIARLDPITGAPDPTWTPTLGAGPGTALVQAIAIDAGAVLVGGSFAQVNGTARANLARLSDAGALEWTGMPAPNGSVSRIVVNGDGIHIAGTFASPRLRLMRLQRDDGQLAAWNPQFDWTLTWSDVLDIEAVGDGIAASIEAAIPFGGGYVAVGEVVTIDALGNAAPLARFNQPVSDILAATDAGSLYVAGLFQSIYALDDFFAQTPRPSGLAQISLRSGTFGTVEAWSPAIAPAGGAPGLALLGHEGAAVLGGSVIPVYPARPGLVLVDAPPGDFLFRDGFDA